MLAEEVPGDAAVAERGHDGADAGQVQVQPDQAGDHAGHHVRHEQRELEEPARDRGAGVEQQCQRERTAEHERDVEDGVQRDDGEAVEEGGVGQGGEVVAEAGEDALGAAEPQPGRLLLEQAQPERVSERGQDDGGEQHEERRGEQQDRPAPAARSRGGGHRFPSKRRSPRRVRGGRRGCGGL
ncbi:hypothetical protein ACFQ0B_80780 [Nonomuraea thailandensis]